MIVDELTSTVRIDDRVFPACGLICPDHPHAPERSEFSRSLGGLGATIPGKRDDSSDEYYVPLESGLLVFIVYYHRRDKYDLALYSAACASDPFNPPEEDQFMLPQVVGIDRRTGQLVTPDVVRWHNYIFGWNDCEADYVVDTIERMSHKPFVIPPGPRARLVSLSALRDLRDGSVVIR